MRSRLLMKSIIKRGGVRGVSRTFRCVTVCFKGMKDGTPKKENHKKKGAHESCAPFPATYYSSMGVLGATIFMAAVIVAAGPAGLAVENLAFHRLAATL